MLRVMIVEDDRDVRAMLATEIAAIRDVEVVAAAKNGHEALSIFQAMMAQGDMGRPPVDAILLDVNMPRMSGPQTARQIRQLDARVVLVMLTMFDTPEALRDSFDAGATGFLTKDCPADEVVDYLRRAVRGEQVVSQRATEVLINAFTQNARDRKAQESLLRQAEALPPRLRGVYELLVTGATNRRVAKVMGLAESTVRIYVSEVLHRLGYNSRAELIAAYAGVGSSEKY